MSATATTMAGLSSAMTTTTTTTTTPSSKTTIPLISTVNEPLSPFILDPNSIALQQQHSKRHFEATWLHTRVNAKLVSSRAEAMGIVACMNKLRHPNLEQLLGVVIGEGVHTMILTCHHPGYSLAHSFSTATPNKPIFSLRTILTISNHAARALFYLHTTTRKGHPSLCDHAIVFDRWQMKAIVLLTPDCEFCPCTTTKLKTTSSVENQHQQYKDHENEENNQNCDNARIESQIEDVRYLASVIARMFSPPARTEQVSVSPVVPKLLRPLLQRCLSTAPMPIQGNANDKPYPKMSDFCNVLTKCLNQLRCQPNL